jgi:hypothetical protein
VQNPLIYQVSTIIQECCSGHDYTTAPLKKEHRKNVDIQITLKNFSPKKTIYFWKT